MLLTICLTFLFSALIIGTMLWLTRDPTEGECDDCGLVWTRRVSGYGGHSDMPFFQCDDCAVIERANKMKQRQKYQKLQKTKLKEAKTYIEKTDKVIKNTQTGGSYLEGGSRQRKLYYSSGSSLKNSWF